MEEVSEIFLESRNVYVFIYMYIISVYVCVGGSSGQLSVHFSCFGVLSP